MAERLTLCLVAALLLAACGSRDVEKDLRVVDVDTGWYDAGIVEGQKNKLVPSISLKLQNVSEEAISGVQLNAVFRLVGEQEAWGDHFVQAIGDEALPAGATGRPLVLRSTLGYTGTQPRLQMLQNREFVDAKVEIYGKHRSRNWAKLGEYEVTRQLLTE